MRVIWALTGLALLAAGLAPLADPLVVPLAAQDADDDDDDDGDDDDDDADVADPDDGADAGGDDAGGADDAGGDDAGGADDAGGDDAGGDDAGGDDAGAGDDAGGDDDAGAGDDAGGDDDGAAGGGDDADDGAADGGNDDADAAGGGDDDADDAAGGDDRDDDAAGGGGDDDDGGLDRDDAGGDDAFDDDRDTDDITDDRGDLDDADEAVDQDPISWEIIVGDTETDRDELDERDNIETDGDGFRYRRGEFVALDLDADDLAELQRGGFEVVERAALPSVAGTLLLLRGPPELTDAAALDALDTLADPDSVGYNHLFDSSAVQTTRRRDAALPQRMACGCEIGLIDTGVANSLANFRHVTLNQRAFNGKAAQPRLHGTAVAHLMAGTVRNPARATKIFVADIFSGPRETAGSSFALIKALDWLAAQGVPVINISLSGPRNPAVASAIARVTKRGHVIVAAAGNDGPAAPPVFPGAYANVIGVTAVDAQNRVYRYANRGAHVDFAARGVAVTAIDADGTVRDATGTSFAAPVIAARLASQLTRPDAAAASAAVRKLEQEARDLGPRGRDSIYGAGLVRETP